jgi:hypothetical protein
LAAVPALRPDVTIIHAQKADKAGNVLVEGIVGVQKEALLAATRNIVTVEEVVDCVVAPGNATSGAMHRCGRISVIPAGHDSPGRIVACRSPPFPPERAGCCAPAAEIVSSAALNAPRK